MRRWLVGGALIRHDDGLVLVGNRRRDRSYEWTPPGGVIDEGERMLQGLGREVFEETGLVVERWLGRRYSVEVEAPEMGWSLRVEAWEAQQVTGDIRIADPDGIVEEVRYVNGSEAPHLLHDSPLWVSVPVGDWLLDRTSEDSVFRFLVTGNDRASATVEQIQ